MLSLGSSKVVTFHGGPLPWILDRSGYYEDGVTNNEEGLRIQPISSSQQQSGDYVIYPQGPLLCMDFLNMKLIICLLPSRDM